MLDFLYNTRPGRVLLRPLTGRTVSRLVGHALDTRLSGLLVKPFVKGHDMDMEEYETPHSYPTFNKFFTRKIKESARPMDRRPGVLMAPCDGYLRAFKIDDDMVLPVKQSRYNLKDLLGGDPAYRKFRNGLCLVFRLQVTDYHRYCFFDGGTASAPVFIGGRLHTVQPVALRRVPVFTENCRSYTMLDSDYFGPAAQIEVGALLVGKICNKPLTGRVERGQEKGFFAGCSPSGQTLF